MTVKQNASGDAAQQEQEQFKAKPPLSDRFFAPKPSSYSADSHTIEMIAYSGARVQRWYGLLELAMDESSVDLSRVSAGRAPLLDSHNGMSMSAKVGTIVSARLVGGALHATAKFDSTDEAKAMEARAARGELAGVSIGFSINPDSFEVVGETDGGQEIWRGGQWTLNEISAVPVPADANAGVLSVEFQPGHTQARENQPMAENTTNAETAAAAATVDVLNAHGAEVLATERKRVKTIRERVKKVGLSEDFAHSLIDDGVAESHIADRIVDELAAHGATGGGAIRVGADNTDPALIRERMAVALAARGTENLAAGRVEMTADAKQFAGLGILDMFADLAEARGEKIDRSLRRAQFRAKLFDTLTDSFMSTSDFPLLLQDAANKILMPAYNLAAPTFFKFAAKRTFNDFKAHHFLREGDFPNLLQVGESGEFTEGSVSEADAAITALTYGRIVAIDRRIIINDDLSAFSQLPAMAGRRAAQVVNTLGFNLLTQNSNLGPSITEAGATHNLFDATNHGNYTSSGTVIAVNSIGVGFAAMQNQTTMDGLYPNFLPRFLVAPPDLRGVAFQYTSSNFQPTISSAVNPYAGTIEPVLDANLHGQSTTAWYLFADPAEAPVFVYGYVAGYEGPRLMTKQGFSNDGVKLRCALDFGCGAVDFRGAYKNAGA